MLVLSLSEELVFPGGGGEVSTFYDEEPVCYHDVDVGDDDCDGFHDIPGEVEIDEIVEESQFCNEEIGEPFNFFLSFSL